LGIFGCIERPDKEDVVLDPLSIVALTALALLLSLPMLWIFRGTGKPSALPAATFPPAPREATWIGWRRFKVRKRVDEDPDGRYASFYLCPVNRRRLPAFEPGQYVQLRVEVPDPDHTGRMKDLVRHYYLSDSANGRYYRVLVQRLESGDGELSPYLIDHLHKGALVELSAPEGDCPFALDDPRPLVVVGVAAGIAPMIALCNTLLDRKSARPLVIFYAMENERDLIYLPNFEYAAGHLPGVRIELCFSESMPAGTVDGATSGDGVVYRKARLGTAFLRKSLALPEHCYYLCGPGEALDFLASDLEALGVPREQIHRAAFTVGTVTTL
jgi:ferredoxin-NADP reductase